jgi:glycosyltransferase involved in cell wall biosynthesis
MLSQPDVGTSPRASILLPARNAAATLEPCLRSIVRQTEPAWECILVDDGSTDGTLACARRFAARDPRVVVVPGPARGLVAALNAGLAACRAPVVARMDADDVMHRDRLAAQLAALDAAPGLAAVGTHVRILPRAGLTDGLRAYERWLNGIDSPARVRAEAFVECPVAHPTLAIRAAVLRAAGYRDVSWPEDYDLVLRLLAAGHDIGVVPRRLLCWRDGPTRLTRTGAAYTLERITACKAAHLAAHLLAHSDEYVLWGYGGTGRALRRALLAHGKRPSHVVEVHPGRVGQRIHGAPVIAHDALARLRHRPVVVSVAGEDARAQIREAMAGMGFRETHDFVCAA